MDSRKAALSGVRPGGVPPAREALPPDRSDGADMARGPDGGGMEAPDRGARLGNGASAGGPAAHGRRPADRAAQRDAVAGADFPTLCGKDVGRMLHLLLVYALEHPDQNTKTQLLAAAPSLWQEENKIQG